MAGNSSLRKANKEKNAEFYTQLSDIENEIRYYKEQLKDKIILCNCDDPFESNFFKYFAMNFNFLGLKKLIATCYDSSPVAYTQLSFIGNDRTTPNKNRRAYKIEITEVDDYNGDGAVDLSDVEYLLKNKENTLSLLKGNGDFRSEECIELLKQADIVVTNPPFYLFRDYISLITENNKDFIVIGNTNALTYKDIFKLFKENRIRTGNTNFNVGMYFYVPDNCEEYHIVKEGKKMVRVASSCWFTSLMVQKHNEFLTCYKRYSPEEYPKYENYNAININQYTDIPYDYDGLMGVPITFLDKYNPQQFEIVALGIVGSIEFTNERKMEILNKKGQPTGKYTVNAKGTLYRKYNPNKDIKPPAFKDVETGELYSSIYARVIIKRRKNNEN
ncbi:MAG: adenine-specific methyltransferase EcoRI family protein [Candidatus Coproplasma sp.]